MKSILLSVTAFIITFFAAVQNIYTLDKNHTKVGFSVTHFGISHVDGRFKNCSVTFKSSKEDFTDAEIEMNADVKSIDTDIDKRDEDLKSDKWFDAEKYPLITFKSNSLKKVTDKNYKLYGNITMHGVTKPIALDVVYNGKSTNPMSKKNSVGFTITGSLKRSDFSVGPAGSTPVSDEVDLISNAEFVID